MMLKRRIPISLISSGGFKAQFRAFTSSAPKLFNMYLASCYVRKLSEKRKKTASMHIEQASDK